jgi:TonB-dependent receptor
MHNKKLCTVIILILTFILSSSIYAQKNGTIKGRITDKDSKEPLMFATITVKGTTQGITSDIEGYYILTNLTPGKHTIVYSFIGYKHFEKEVEISPGKTMVIDITLEAQSIIGKEVTITSQARGQASAINEQLKSNKIVNVVSRERIEELPDQNAAEAIGRLPGISVQRDGGEGQKVVIRGLSPKYSLITINGSRISPTDIADRSVDLSMISSEMLAGIEVFKANTPDNDGDALGGTVNFSVKKANKGFHGRLDANTSYNNLADKFGMYRGSLVLSNRFFNDKLGVLFTGNIQQANRSSEGFTASYAYGGEKQDGSAITNTENLNLETKDEIRNRYGASAVLDYQLENGSIVLNSIYSLQQRDQLRRRRRYRVAAAYQQYEIRDSEQNTALFSNGLTGIHHVSTFEISWKAAYSITQNKIPNSNNAQFRETAAFTSDLVINQGPEMIPKAAKNNLDKTYWYKSILDESLVKNHNIMGQLDFKRPYKISDKVNGYLKFGGKLRYENRNRNVSQWELRDDYIAPLAPPEWEVDRVGIPLVTNFILYQDTSAFLGNDAYQFGPVIGNKDINQFASDNRKEYREVPSKDLEDYKAGEIVSSAYIMTEIDLTEKLMLLGGIRLEHTSTNYKSIYGTAIRRDDGTTDVSHIVDTTGERKYLTVLPMFHVRYKPLKWFDIRLAVTRGLSRPNYFDLVPWERYTPEDYTWERGNPELHETTSWNYDAFLSFYGNFGLFTIGAFYKDIQNTIYNRKTRITKPESDFYGTFLISPVNDQHKSFVQGIETEFQANLRFLPKPFSNFVIYANYTFMKSQTNFPVLTSRYIYYDHPPYAEIIFTDTIRTGRMPGQADDIANASLGYESRGFSARLSMTYQGDYINFVGTRKEYDEIVQGFFRWDFNTQFKFKNDLTVYLNLNNISNTPEAGFLGDPFYPLQLYYYGWSVDLGLKYKF